MSSTGPSATENTAAKASSSPNVAPATSAIAIPSSTEIPRSEPIAIIRSFQAARSQSKPMANSAPGRFTLDREDTTDILGTSPPDKGRPKIYKW